MEHRAHLSPGRFHPAKAGFDDPHALVAQRDVGDRLAFAAPHLVAPERDRMATELHDRHRLSPFAGRPLRGRVVRTLVRGTTVFRDGHIVAEPLGRLLTPTKGDPA